jgi:7-carboxy-7-deazaguanine synthase
MTYSVKEIFFTLQGEGYHTARPAVFLRFAGCNLWTGLEADRATAICQFCDTDFVGTNGPGGGKFRSAESLAAAVAACWKDPPPDMLRLRQQIVRTAGPDEVHQPYVVCTGGEPLLQLDGPLIAALHAQGFEIAIETNGTLAAPPGIDWICVSPKAGAPLVQRSGNELKLVYPQPPFDPESFESLKFEHFFLQPMDGLNREANTAAAEEYCRHHPRWKVSLQTHKLLGIP